MVWRIERGARHGVWEGAAGRSGTMQVPVDLSCGSVPGAVVDRVGGSDGGDDRRDVVGEGGEYGERRLWDEVWWRRVDGWDGR